MSTVAIVMAAYNGEKFISEQIDSILASSYQDFELYIYDDGSKDQTVSIIKEYEAQYPSKIHVYQNDTNLGLTANFLHALCRTTTDYIMFCDQDDYWKSNKIAVSLKRIRNMEAQSGKEIPMAVFTDAAVTNADLKVLKESFFASTHLNPGKTDLPHILMENKLIGCTTMVNGALRKVVQHHAFPTKAKYHDWWIALTAASMGRICFINERTLLYRQHSGNVVGGSSFLSYVGNRIAALGRQRDELRMLFRQAEEFLSLYQELLAEDTQNIIRFFAELEQYGYIERRIIILQKGFLKTGVLRNLGLMLII